MSAWIRHCIVIILNYCYLFIFKLLHPGLRDNVFICNGRIWGVKVKVTGRGNRIVIEDGAILNRKCSITINGDNNEVRIGNKTTLSEGGRIRIEGNGCWLVVGERSCLVNVFFSIGDDNNGVTVGNDCLFSSDVIFRTWDNHSIIMVDKPEVRICKGESINIEDHVWIGNGVTILKGVNIKRDCIVGTKSVVTKSVEANKLVVGCPAHAIKSGISWNVEWLKQTI